MLPLRWNGKPNMLAFRSPTSIVFAGWDSNRSPTLAGLRLERRKPIQLSRLIHLTADANAISCNPASKKVCVALADAVLVFDSSLTQIARLSREPELTEWAPSQVRFLDGDILLTLAARKFALNTSCKLYEFLHVLNIQPGQAYKQCEPIRFTEQDLVEAPRAMRRTSNQPTSPMTNLTGTHSHCVRSVKKATRWLSSSCSPKQVASCWLLDTPSRE